jgi:hypothetical protein
MSLSYRQQRQLRLIEAGLVRSDSRLGVMFGTFGRLNAGQDMTAWEQVPQAASSQHRLRRAAARIVAMLTAVSAAITILLGAGLEADAGEDADGDRKPRHQGHADDGLRSPDGPV